MKKFTSLVMVAVFGVSALAQPFVAPTETEAYTTPGYNGKITFGSNRDGNREIYIMNADGTGQTRLTNTPEADTTPVFSPDGSKIAFRSERDGHREIYVMNADGSDETRLTNTTANSWQPVWSPDGSQMVFGTYRDGNYELYLMNADGSSQTRLTNAVGTDREANWSPDGTKILFNTERDGNSEIYVMDADGSNQVNITNDLGFDFDPQWSPDGSKILFSSNRSGDFEIYTMDADGTNPTSLTSDDYSETEFYGWSPDGSKVVIALVEYTTPSSKMIIVDADGSNRREMVFSSTDIDIIERVSWSPDGKKILVTAYPPDWSAYNLHTVEVDTFEISTLTNQLSSGYGDWAAIPNVVPATVIDSIEVPYQTPTLADVLANDTDEEVLSGHNLNITLQPTNGTASVVDGKIRYVPNAGYAGTDNLSYEICDSFVMDQLCSDGLVNLTVLEAAPPVVSVVKINGELYRSEVSQYVTSSLRPTFSGTASPGAEITVEIHSDPIVLTTTADGSGNWSVTPGFDLPSGEHMVFISATLNGLTTELDSFGLTVQASLANTGGSLGWTVLGGLSLVGGSIGLVGARRKQEHSAFRNF